MYIRVLGIPVISIVLFIVGMKSKNQAVKYIIGAILMFLGLYFWWPIKDVVSISDEFAVRFISHLTIITPPILGIILLIHTYFKFKKN